MQEMNLVLDLLDMPVMTIPGVFMRRMYSYQTGSYPSLIDSHQVIKFDVWQPYLRTGVTIIDFYSAQLDGIIPKGTKIIFDLSTEVSFVVLDNVAKCSSNRSRLNLPNEKRIKEYCLLHNIVYAGR